MAVVVRRVYSGTTGMHNLSIVADGADVRYVLATGRTDPALTPERTKKFAAVFAEINGRDPETSEDWAECASYNMGLAEVSDPMEQRYMALSKVMEIEQGLLDDEVVKAEAPDTRTIRDADVDPSSTALAMVDDSDNVLGVILLEDRSGDLPMEWYRVEGGWTDQPSLGMNSDATEDLVGIEVSPSYGEAFDQGSRTMSDVESYRTTSEEQ